MRHASHLVPFETEPNRDLKKGESAREDPWYEQPRITKLPTIHLDRADGGKVPDISYAFSAICMGYLTSDCHYEEENCVEDRHTESSYVSDNGDASRDAITYLMEHQQSIMM